jgi:hypothetical protein
MVDDALIRWEKERQDRLAGAITLMFGMSSASLAFCTSLLTKDSFVLGGHKTCCFLTATVCFILALLASVLATLTRLLDARATADIVRIRGDIEKKVEVTNLRKRARSWGWWTWTLFYVQLATFSAGAVFLLISLCLIFQSKLFP